MPYPPVTLPPPPPITPLIPYPRKEHGTRDTLPPTPLPEQNDRHL